MRLSKSKFVNMVEEVIDSYSSEFYKYRVDDLNLCYVRIRKENGVNNYNITVSIDDLNTPIQLIKDIMQETCDRLDISMGNLTIEV